MRHSMFQAGGWIAAVLLGTVGLLAPTYAQEFRASITGQVVDSSGAAIPGATVTAVNVTTQVRSSTKSNDQGIYSLLYVLSGTYTVTVEAAKFQTAVYQDVHLDSAQKLELNVTLQPGSVTQQVVVTAGAVDLDTVSATTGGVIDQAKVQNMPAIAMSTWDDVLFTQGIKAEGEDMFNNTPRAQGGIAYTVSGTQTDENAFYINGAPISDQGVWYMDPSVDSTAQMEASAFAYDSEYGRNGGGAFNATVKGGTNAYHGAIYDYYGNKALNANTWSADLAGVAKTPDTRNTWGAESGGPIRKGKTFYFASYEGFDQYEPGTVTDTVPTTGSTGEASGDFTGTGYTIYDPTSTYCAQTTTSGCELYARTEFPNDAIPSQDISPIGQKILSYYPAPNKPGLTDNYVAPAVNKFLYDQIIGRVDQNFSQNTRMYAMFLREGNEVSAGGFGNGTTGPAATIEVEPDSVYIAMLDLTHVFSPTKVLDLKASWLHNAEVLTTGYALADNFTASNLGFSMPAVESTPHQNIAPEILVTGATTLFGNTSSGTADQDIDYSGSVTQLLGRHSLHYGGEIFDIQTAPTGVLGQPNGAFTFDPTYSQENPLTPATGSGNAFADILLGYPTSGSLSWDEPTYVTMHYYAAFIQDDFKARSNLNLNLGLRWDVNTSPRDRNNWINSGFCLTCTNPYSSSVNFASAPQLTSPLLGGLEFAAVNGQSNTPYAVQWNDWQPRVGFSWEALRDTVIRGGYGIYFPYSYLSVADEGFSQTTSFTASLNGDLNPDTYFNSGTPYPSGAIAPTGSSDGLETDAGDAVSFYDQSRRLRMTQHWSFGFQRRMPGQTFLDIEYLGTTVHRIPVNTAIDVVSTAVQQECLATPAICNTDVSNPFYGILPTATTLGAASKVPAWELMRAYPLFNGVTEDLIPDGSSHYNGLTARVERRLKSFDFVFNYTYSNWMDRDSYLNDTYFIDPSLNKHLDPGDNRNYINANLVYPIPGTANRGSAINYLTNGWLFASSVIWGTGTPLALPSNANFNWGTQGCNSYAAAGGQSRAHWFNNNESCWTQISTWEPLTTPAYIGFIRNPSFVMWNPALSRDFPLHREGMHAEFRMLAMNGANHPTWGAPSTSVATLTGYSPTTSWTGFGTLPTSEDNIQRQFMASMTITF